MASQEGVSLLSLLWVAPQEDHIAGYLVVLAGWYQGCALGNRGLQTILSKTYLLLLTQNPPLSSAHACSPSFPPVDAMRHCNSLFICQLCSLLLLFWFI